MWLRLDARALEDWLVAQMNPEVRQICGRSCPDPIEAGDHYLELPSASIEELCMWGIYLFILRDKKGKVIGVYVGSGTGVLGVFQRVWGYDVLIGRARRLGRIPAHTGSYVKLAMTSGFKLDIRPLFLVDKSECSVPRMILVEGIFTDMLNTFDISDPSRHKWRTEATIAAYPEAVLDDMLQVKYKPLNRAHQFAQGARRKSPPCCLIGKGCPEKHESTMVMFVSAGKLRYGCQECWDSWYFFARREFRAEMSTEAKFDAFVKFKLAQRVTHRNKPIPKDGRCAVCDEPADSRIFFGDVGSRLSCTNHSIYWNNSVHPGEIAARNQADDLDAWEAAFKEFVSHYEGVAETKRLREEDEDTACRICNVECEIADLQCVPKAMKDQFGTVPLPEVVPVICKGCVLIWQRCKNGSKLKTSIQVGSFEQYEGYCVESRLHVETVKRAKEATCVCGSPAVYPPKDHFQYKALYDGFCVPCNHWIDNQRTRHGTVWSTQQDFENACRNRERR